VKVPLAAAVLDRIHRGELDGAQPRQVEPGRVATPGPMGLTRFRHPATVAVDDLLYLSTSVSDNTAADALFDLVPPPEVARFLSDAGIVGITVRHRLHVLAETPAERFEPRQAHLAHSLAIGASTPGRGHPLPQLDVSRANTGTAAAFADLLAELWAPRTLLAAAAARARALMRDNVVQHRLAPDFAADDVTWSSKTGTLLNLRHEIGAAEHADGRVILVAALTESAVPAVAQPAAEAQMAGVARQLHDHLRIR